ncbi:P1 [Amphibola crenata associated bacilladnavirus 1]|uniref:p1 n=1 Tax=Amphibola crenata associated bacilladnavirus 1 TaxID=1941435 RepID=A0A1P8YT82_9VIRU|nr:P1 [Amphibola crenata associated bacilladnavirus 1]AQA27288.1 P1 [Amphibola crenata associated bacilladnavirus 1]
MPKKSSRRRRTTATTKKKSSSKKAAKKGPTTKKVVKKVMGASAIALKPLVSPFDRSNMQPKIPDGKVGESVGLKFTMTKEYSNKTLTTMHAMLFPGQSGGLFVSGCQNVNGINREVQAYANAGGFSYTYDNTTKMALLTANEKYHSWRIVSQAAKFELLNPAEEDDGWWEAVRITDMLSLFDYHVEQHSNKTGRLQGVFVPFLGLLNLEDRALTAERTYESGRLKDIHKREFHLRQVKDEVDFTQLCSPIALEGVQETGAGTSGSPFVLANGAGANAGESFGMQNYNAMRNYIDFGYDCIYFRFHCRDPASATRLLTHVVSNQEIQYSSESGESRFQTANTRHAQVDTVMANRSNGGATTSVPSTSRHNPHR